MTHLWSIQSAPFFDQVLDKGEGITSWEFVNKKSQAAYRWMAEQMTQRLGRGIHVGHGKVRQLKMILYRSLAQNRNHI